MATHDDKTLLRTRVALARSAPRRATHDPTDSDWKGPQHASTLGDPQLTIGSVIKNRFILQAPIGRGGMGTVYKARDLRKEEAQDRNPYVAIKVLNEDFKQHPHALQALQRESRKSQKLAHPNIVTVFDFDRDGANAYMVMELLEGEPLDRLIKRKKDVGLGVKDAIRLMGGICRAMDYAHQQGIMHADFKPANVFLTSSGVVKVFDFGIARAFKAKDRPDADGVTRFDPGTLGALTPAYAGCEVMEGEAPDPRDDVYAIACVAYELVTGSHPYNRLSASQADKAKMTPDRPSGMSPWQWRALRRALSLRREGRPHSAGELLDGLRPLIESPAMFACLGIVIVALVALAAVPISRQIDGFRERGVIAALASSDAGRIEPILSTLRTLAPARRASLFLHDEARTGFIKYYAGRVGELVDPSKGHYDYPGAESLVYELEEFLPDSQAVADVHDRLSAQKGEALKKLSDALDLDLEHGWLIPTQSRENVTTLLARIGDIDPHNPLLSDPRLLAAYVDSAGQALKSGQPALADALAAAGLAVAPRDAALLDLRTNAQHVLNERKEPAIQADAAARQIESDGRLRSQLEAGLERPALSLTQARLLAHLTEELRRHADPQASSLANSLEGRLVQNAAMIESKDGLDAAVIFSKGASSLFPESTPLRQTLTRLLAAVAQRDSMQRTADIAKHRSAIEALLENPSADNSWAGSVQKEIDQLAAYSPDTDVYQSGVKASVAAVCVTEAARLRAMKRLSEAGKLLRLSREYQPESLERSMEEALLADAFARQSLGDQKVARSLYVSSLRRNLMTQAASGDVASAEMTLRVLRESLPADDRFMMREGPEAIAQAYRNMAWQAATNGQLKSAVEWVNRGLAVAPSMEALVVAHARYLRYQGLDDYLTGVAEPDVHKVRDEIADLYKQDAETARVLVPLLARDLASRLHTTGDPQLAVRLSQVGSEIFGQGPPFHHD